MRFISPDSPEYSDLTENLSTLKHASLDYIPKNNIRHYRGPTPSISNIPDNMYVFYEQQGYRGQRTFQPTLKGSLN